MAQRKTADDWFAGYGVDQIRGTARAIQIGCVPLVFWSLLGFVWSIPVPPDWAEAIPWFNWALVAIAVATAFYVQISPALSAGLLFLMAVGYVLLVVLDLYVSVPVWRIACVSFVVGWAGQVAARIAAHREPSFRRDLEFIFIGPAWLTSLAFRKLGQTY